MQQKYRPEIERRDRLTPVIASIVVVLLLVGALAYGAHEVVARIDSLISHLQAAQFLCGGGR